MGKWTLTFEGDMCEDADDLVMLAKNKDYYLSIVHALEEIRSRLKYTDDLSDSESRFLEKLRETLHIEEL